MVSIVDTAFKYIDFSLITLHTICTVVHIGNGFPSTKSLIAVTSLLYPVFWIFWGALYTPIRLVMGCSGAIARVFSIISEVILDMWEFSSGILRFTSEVESTVTAAEVSMWRALWNDLFSQVG